MANLLQHIREMRAALRHKEFGSEYANCAKQIDAFLMAWLRNRREIWEQNGDIMESLKD
jgi:hypothetical protein